MAAGGLGHIVLLKDGAERLSIDWAKPSRLSWYRGGSEFSAFPRYLQIPRVRSSVFVCVDTYQSSRLFWHSLSAACLMRSGRCPAGRPRSWGLTKDLVSALVRRPAQTPQFGRAVLQIHHAAPLAPALGSAFWTSTFQRRPMNPRIKSTIITVAMLIQRNSMKRFRV